MASLDYFLNQGENGLCLMLHHPSWRPLQVDFTQGALYYRYQHLSNELLAKAIGWKKNTPLHVFDTTAGLGREAFLLAALGCEVTLFERHVLIAALLKDGLQRAANHPQLSAVIQRMQLIEKCAITYLQNECKIYPDVIYCDPMFPTRTKSAAVKKEMQLLQNIVGLDQDGSHLVSCACKLAKKRVVVKRSKTAPYLQGTPDFSLCARSHRFDIYLRKSYV